MLKLLGAGLILSVCTLYGLQMKQRLFQHVQQLIGCKEVLLMLCGEISYARAPLREAFLHIAAQGKEPFGSFLEDVAARMEQEQQKPLSEIWSSALLGHQDEICFTREEQKLLQSIGENFGYLDVQMQLGHLNLCIQQLEAAIIRSQEELSAKQKLHQSLSVLGGLFLILILL